MSREPPAPPARILHAPHNIGGQPFTISRAERKLGFESDVIVLGGEGLGYEHDINLNVSGRRTPGALAKRFAFLMRAAHHYDVFHYTLGATIMTSLGRRGLLFELPMLRRMGKIVLATFQGSDGRPPEHNHFPQPPELIELHRRTQPRRRAAMLRHAHRVFTPSPENAPWLPGCRVIFSAHVDPDDHPPVPPPDGEEIVIAHAPTKRAVKGTDQVIETVDSLRAEGLPVRLDLIEGVPPSQIMPRFAQCDIGLDQLHLGSYGGVAVEMMTLGRPVLSRIRDEWPFDSSFYGPDLPIVRTTPETVRDDLRALVLDRERRHALGRAGREFAERNHDPKKIARLCLEGLVPIPVDGG
jgi:glycosyltransferase involved in cell wall biosynthesis